MGRFNYRGEEAGGHWDQRGFILSPPGVVAVTWRGHVWPVMAASMAASSGSVTRRLLRGAARSLSGGGGGGRAAAEEPEAAVWVPGRSRDGDAAPGVPGAGVPVLTPAGGVSPSPG